MAAPEQSGNSAVDGKADVAACQADYQQAAQARAESNPANTPRVPAQNTQHRR